MLINPLKKYDAVQKNILITAALLFAIQTVTALSLSILKSLIDLVVTKKFPKEKLTITLDQPVTKFSKER